MSRSSITLTEKCLPTSRRNSIADSSRGPGQVVLDDGAGRRVVEVDEALELAADPVGPLGDGVGGVQRALAGVARIADHAGRAAGQHDRPVPGLLEPPQRQQRHQVSGVQARRGRVEARVDGDRARGQLRRPARRGRWTARSARASPARRGCSPLPMDSIFPYQSLCAGRRCPRAAAVRPTPPGGRPARTATAGRRPG